MFPTCLIGPYKLQFDLLCSVQISLANGSDKLLDQTEIYASPNSAETHPKKTTKKPTFDVLRPNSVHVLFLFYANIKLIIIR